MCWLLYTSAKQLDEEIAAAAKEELSIILEKEVPGMPKGPKGTRIFTRGDREDVYKRQWQDWRSTLRQYGIVDRQIYAAGFGILSLKGAQSP